MCPAVHFTLSGWVLLLLLQVYGAVWNNFQRCHDKLCNVIVRPGMFVTYGVKHLKIWTLEQNSVSSWGWVVGSVPEE